MPHSLTDRVVHPLSAFEIITTAWQAGRPVVPLFGAGLSIEAGIPGTTQIGEYLIKVQYLSESAPNRDASAGVDAGVSWLGNHGWPDFNEVDTAVLTTFRRVHDADGVKGHRKIDGAVFEQIIEDHLKREFHEVFDLSSKPRGVLSDEPTLYALLTQWRTLLRRLTEGDPALLDPFFTVLAQGRRPGRGHLFASALCRALGWRLLLTTNFDPLLEDSLTEAGMVPGVHPLREDGALPDPSLVHSGLSVVKLHGGRFSVRFSDVLDTAAGKADVERFLQYLGPRAMLLVLGYRGTDRRVMSMIRAHLHNASQVESHPAVLWICRGDAPLPLARMVGSDELRKRLSVASFHDIGLFLQELYTRIRRTFPASARNHPAITDAPTKTHTPGPPLQEAVDKLKKVRAPVVAIVSDVVGRGTSTLLSILARMHERSHRVIWCDFEEISSVSALVSHILREMQSSDPHLTPLLLAHEAGGDEASSTTTNFRPLHGMHDPRISRLFDALRRGKYFIAIDSMGEFGRSQVGHDLSEPSTKVDLRYAQVCSFLAAIAERGGELGESRVAFVHSPVIIPESDATAVPQSPISSNEAVILGDGPGEIDPATPTQFPHPAVQPLNRSPESPAAEQQEPPEQRQGGETPDPSLPKSQDESSVRDGLGETAIYPHPGMENFPMPQRIGGHEVRGELARGKQGIVYKVFHEAFGRHLAAKLLFPTSREKIEDLLNEARKAVQLDHPNIVRVFDARVDDECKLPFILYEYVTGGRLIDHMSPLSAGLSLFERMRIVAEVAAALHHAHTAAKPIIHRDVKPDNILLDHHSHAKVVDFGLAISEGDNMQLGGGALRYMSPEQIRQITKLLEPAHQKSYPVGPASDIYSLGVVMFELLTGQTPYAVPMPLEEWNRLLFPRQLQAWQQLIERDEVPSAIQIENRVPKPLDHICWKCLQLNAEGRYRTAQELANAVCAWLESTETTEATTVQQRIWREYHKLKDELARLSTSPANDGDQQRHPDQSSARMDHSAFPVRQTAVEYAPAAIAYRDSGTERGLTKILEPGANLEVIWKQIVGQGNSAIAAARVVWESLKFDHQAVLVVAAAFRRPRSIVALRRIGGILLQSGGNPSSEHVLRILTRLGPGDLDRGISRERTWATPESSLAAGMQTDTKLSNGFSATDAEVEKRIDGVLADLEEANLLIRQEGGFYWMHCAVRDAIFRECSRLEPQGMANLHEQIAYFYYEAVFRPTRDARAFNEFVAHQLLAIRESPPSNRVERLRSLRNCLDRERANLLGRTHPETLLDWVRTIRDVELPRLERGRSANAPADGAAKSVFDDLRASLCDLEGDVHQYSTNYEAGIAVRLKQISDRIEVLQRWMSEKPDRKWIDQARDKLVAKNYHPVTDAFFQDFSQRLVDCLKKVLSEGPGNDSAESINENISRLGAVLPGMLKKLLSEKVPDGYPESAHAEFCDELAADLVQSLRTSCDDKLSDGICEAAKAAWSHLFSLKLAAAMKQSFFEQLSVEIVSSMKSLCTSLASARAADAKASAGLSARTSYDQRVECVDARQSAATDTYRRYVQHVRDIAVCLQGLHYPREARTLFELIKSEVEPFCQALTAVAGDSPRASPGLRNWSARLACSCSLRLMDSWSGDVYTWDSLEQPEKQLSLDNVDREYGKAIQSLKYYSGDLRADFARNVCSLRALFARTHYLNGRFVEAHSQLDVAEASVHPENGANERMALAVCELRRAECMMLEADALCRKSSPEEGAALARNRLNLAGTSLEHAWQLLSAEPGHVWRWSLFFLERTQLIHEELLYTYLMETCDGDLAQKERRGQLIRRGLSSISSALDNIEKDRKRWKHLEILWWQFYLCFLFGRDLQLLDAWPDWKTRNANAGLDWFFEQQANHSYSRLQPLIDASIEEIRNRKVTRPKEVTLREIIIAFQRTVIGPSGRSASLR